MNNNDATAEQRECWIEPQIVSLNSKESAIYFKVGPDGSTYAKSTRS